MTSNVGHPPARKRKPLVDVTQSIRDAEKAGPEMQKVYKEALKRKAALNSVDRAKAKK